MCIRDRLKPIRREKLKQSLTKLMLLEKGNSSESSLPNLEQLRNLLKPKSVQRFTVQIGNKIKILESHQIAYFKADQKITFAVTKADKRYPMETSLKQLEVTLPTTDFFRVNRQFLLNRACIDELYYLTTGRLSVKIQPMPKEEIIVERAIGAV